MQILLCDDDKEFLNQLEEKINLYLDLAYIKRTIFKYDDSREVEKEMLENIDIAFLDIDMPYVPGFQLAQMIQEKQGDVILIFLTNRDDLVFQAFDYQPFRFLRKSMLDVKLEDTLSRVIEKYTNEALFYEVSVKGNAVKIKMKDIYYFECEGHEILIYTKNGKYCIREKMKNIHEKLNKYGFYRIQAGFIVNMRFVNQITNRGVVMDNGDILPIKRGIVKELQKIHLQYMRKHIYGDYEFHSK